MNIFQLFGRSLADRNNTTFLANSIHDDICNGLLKSDPFITKLLDEAVIDLFDAQERAKRAIYEISQLNN